MSLALGLVVVVAHHWRWLAAIGAAVVATLFGTGVLTTGWHRPSDVLGAFLLSLAWYSLVMAALVRWRGRGDPQRLHADAIEERAGPLLTTLVGALLLAALTVVLVASLEADGLRTVPYSVDYVVATLLIDVVGIVIVAAFHLLMRDVSPDPPAPRARDGSAVGAQVLGNERPVERAAGAPQHPVGGHAEDHG
jgi:hypothetical protein